VELIKGVFPFSLTTSYVENTSGPIAENEA
jgi:hypothetical protein